MVNRDTQRKVTAAVKKHLALFLVYGGLASAGTAYMTLHVPYQVLENVRNDAYDKALVTFNAGHKDRLKSDNKYLNKVCYSWWFDMNTKDRIIKPIKTPKKGTT